MSQRLANTLAQRAGPNADAERVAQALVAICQEISAALGPILGQQGVAALYQRCLQSTARAHVWLAPASDGPQEGPGSAASAGMATLRAAFAQQSPAEAMAGGTAFLLSFFELLGSLIGLALTEQLLQPLFENQL